MSCFSRLLGLICAVVPGLLFLAFSVLFVTLWPRLGLVTGSLYSLASFVTGAVCLYLGIGILFGRDRKETDVAAENFPPPTVNAPAVSQPSLEAQPLQAAPLPVLEAAQPIAPEPIADDAATSTPPVPDASVETFATAPDSPEIRIRQLAVARPNWRVTAPQLAHATNLNMGVADAAARAMVNNGQAQIEIGPGGETIYIFDLA